MGIYSDIIEFFYSEYLNPLKKSKVALPASTLFDYMNSLSIPSSTDVVGGKKQFNFPVYIQYIWFAML